ncbi:MAG: SGNH/GDSL hydrolase family protein [Candidatus Omnitrophica bacterium]|nr:SGNH/GDSL hydrolase family protein [Candidatus Omnitrophota bacterium]
METTKSKKGKFAVTTVFFVLAVCFILAESGIRIYHLTCDRERFVWLPDQFLAYVHSGNNTFKHHYTEKERITVEHKTNSFGFLSDEITVEKDKDTFRVLVMGDSFTEAFQVPGSKNFCGRLQDLLNNYPEKKYKKVEVLNTGVSGYSPLNYYLYFKRELARFEPDLVLVQLFANDVFEDNTAKAKSLLDENGLALKTNRYFSQEYFNHPAVKTEDFNGNPFGYRLKRFLIEKSRAFEYFYVKFYNTRKASDFNQKMIRVDQYGTGYQFFMLDPGHVLSKDEAFREKAWGYTQKNLLALKKEVEGQKAELRMFYIPMEVQLKLDRYGEHVSLYVQKHMGTYFNDLLDDFSRKNNIRFLDLLENFENNKAKGLYLSRDGHLTETGHEIAAETLFNDIINDDLLSEFLPFGDKNMATSQSSEKGGN